MASSDDETRAAAKLASNRQSPDRQSPDRQSPDRQSPDPSFVTTPIATKPMANVDFGRPSPGAAPQELAAVASDSEALRAALADSRAYPAALPADLANHARYRIIRQLGVGGMGVVYQAEHRLMERPVALKVISQMLVNDAQAVERFRMEVKAAAKLSHPNIVTAFDAEQAGDLHFLVMEYVDGLSLARQVEMRGPLPLQFACGFIRQVALGLQHAYEKGMVHRDIKPQNLMVTRAGRVKILDFGLARLAREKTEPSGPRGATPALPGVGGDGQATLAFLVDQAANLQASLPGGNATDGGLTAAGSTIGTPDYIAPEQIENSRAADIRSDIYSLGGTFYFLLTGSPPFPGGSIVDKLVAHHQRPPRSVSELRPDVPAEVVSIVRRMLAKDPRDRFQTPAEIAQALLPFSRAAGTKPGSATQPLEAAGSAGTADSAGTANSAGEGGPADAEGVPTVKTGTRTDVGEGINQKPSKAKPSVLPPAARLPARGSPPRGRPDTSRPNAGMPSAGMPSAGAPSADVWNANGWSPESPNRLLPEPDAAAGFDFAALGEPLPDFGSLPGAAAPAGSGRSRKWQLSDWVSQPFDNRTLVWLGGIGAFAVASMVVLIAITSWLNNRQSSPRALLRRSNAMAARSGGDQAGVGQLGTDNGGLTPPGMGPAGDRRRPFPPPGPRPPAARKNGRIKILVVIPQRDLYYPDFGNLLRAIEKKSLTESVVVASSAVRPAVPEVGFRAEHPEIPVDIALADAVPSDFDAVIFTGAFPMASMEFLARGSSFASAERFVKEMLRRKRCVAGICGGIAVLADTGAVRGQTVAHNPYAMEAVQPGHGIIDWDKQRRVISNAETHVATATDAADAMKLVEAVLGQIAQQRDIR